MVWAAALDAEHGEIAGRRRCLDRKPREGVEHWIVQPVEAPRLIVRLAAAAGVQR